MAEVERERKREAMCECVCDGEEEMQREGLNTETMLMVNGSPLLGVYSRHECG